MGKTQAAEQRKIGVSISLEAGTVAEIDEVARAVGMSRSELVERIVENWVEEEDDEEDRALGKLAKERLADPNEGRVPWEQVKQRLGL